MTVIELGSRYGKLWEQQPLAAPTGRVATLKFASEAFVDAAFTGVAFTANSLAAGSNNVGLFALHLTGNRFSQLSPTESPCTCLSANPRTDELAAGFANGDITVFGTSGQHKLQGHRRSVVGLAFDASGSRLVSCSQDAVMLWDTQTNKRSRVLRLTEAVLSATFLPSDDSVLTLSKDGAVSVWSTSTGLIDRRFDADPCAAFFAGGKAAFAVSPDAHWLASAGSGPFVFVWDVHDARLMYALHVSSGHDVLQLAFLPDSRTIAVLDSDSTIAFVDAIAAEELYSIAGATEAPCDAFAMDSRANYLAALGADGAITLFDLTALRRACRGNPRLKLQRTLRESLPALAQQWAGACNADQNTGAWGNMVRGGVPGRRSQKAKAPRPRASARSKPQSPAPEGEAVESGAQRLPLATLDRDAHNFSLTKLQKLLDAYGEYPDKHRLLIWEFLLQLPHNHAAYDALDSKGPHPCVADLAARYPRRDPALLRTLSHTISQLSHWCPLFAELGFLPNLAFPFVKLFRRDGETCFEAVATMVLNWGRHWFQFFPHPPLAHLTRFEAMLQYHDPQVCQHMARWEGGCIAPAWELMSTLLTEVLNRQEWLKVWDHVLSNPPEFYTHVVMAYLLFFRKSLLSADSPAQLILLSRRHAALEVSKVLQRAYVSFEVTPEAYRPLAAPFQPLPVGSVYPEFVGFPAQAVASQRSKREMLAEQEAAVKLRQRQLDELKTKGREMEVNAVVVGRERERLAQLASERRAALKRLEEELTMERVRLDFKAKEERLRQIGLVEEQYRSHLQLMREEMRAEVDRLQDELEHKRRLHATELAARAEDEQILALEFEARQRMWAIEQAQVRRAAAARVRADAEAKELALEAGQRQALAEMAAKDEATKLRAQHEAARQSRMAALAEEAAAAAETTAALSAREIEAQSRVSNARLQQTLRLLAEQEAAATQEAIDAERARLEAACKLDADAVAARIAEGNAWLEQEQTRREDALAREREAVVASKHARLALYSEMERTSRKRDLDAQSAASRRLLEKQNALEEAQTRRLLTQLERERLRDHDLRMELLLKEEELKARSAQGRAEVAGEASGSAVGDGASPPQQADADAAAATQDEASRRRQERLAASAMDREFQREARDAASRDEASAREAQELAELRATLDERLKAEASAPVFAHLPGADALRAAVSSAQAATAAAAPAAARARPAGVASRGDSPESRGQVGGSAGAAAARAERVRAAAEISESSVTTDAPDTGSSVGTLARRGADARSSARAAEQDDLRRDLQAVRALVQDLNALRSAFQAQGPAAAEDERPRAVLDLEDARNEPEPPTPVRPGVPPSFMTPATRTSKGGEAFFVEAPSRSLRSSTARRSFAASPAAQSAAPAPSQTAAVASGELPVAPALRQTLTEARAASWAQRAATQPRHDVPALFERFKHLVDEGRALGVVPATAPPPRTVDADPAPLSAAAPAAADAPDSGRLLAGGALGDARSASQTQLDAPRDADMAALRSAVEALRGGLQQLDGSASAAPGDRGAARQNGRDAAAWPAATASAPIAPRASAGSGSTAFLDVGGRNLSSRFSWGVQVGSEASSRPSASPADPAAAAGPSAAPQLSAPSTQRASDAAAPLSTWRSDAAARSNGATALSSAALIEQLQQRLRAGRTPVAGTAVSTSFGKETTTASTATAPTLRPNSQAAADDGDLLSESSDDSSNPLSTPKKRQRSSGPVETTGRRQESMLPRMDLALSDVSPGSDVTQSLDLSVGLSSDVLGNWHTPATGVRESHAFSEGATTTIVSETDTGL